MDDITIIVTDKDTLLLDTLVTGNEQPIQYIAIAEQGLPGVQGLQGPAGPSSWIPMVAGENLSGHRFVTSNLAGDAMYPTTDSVIGMTTGAIMQGANGFVASSGVVEEPSWNWTPQQPLYLQPNGFISHVPYSLWIKEIGTAISSTRIKIEIKSTILTGV